VSHHEKGRPISLEVKAEGRPSDEGPTHPDRERSPLMLLLIITISIFVIEAFLMFILSLLPPLSTAKVIFLDSFLLIALVFPPLYYFVFRPLVQSVTERELADEELKLFAEHLEKSIAERTRELEESNTLKDLFTDIMSHDLLNPAGVIKNYAELQIEDAKDKDDVNNALRIKNNAERLIEMIENASKFARLESSKKLRYEKLILDELFREVIEGFMPLIEKKGLNLEYGKWEKGTVAASPVLKDVFSNLLSNAIKYSPDGGKIELGMTDEGKTYKVQVGDRGEGVEDEDKTMIFERFKRIKKEGVKGTGLGLSIAKRIMDMHHGKIWVEDNPEGGSVFIFEIPKSQRDADKINFENIKP